MVRMATNEDGTGPIAAMVPVGNKSTYPEVARTGITGADSPTGGDLTVTGFAGTAGANLIDLGNSLAVMVRGTSSSAAAVLTGRVILYTAAFAPLGSLATVTLTAHGTNRLGNASGNFIANVAIQDVGAARMCRFFVDTVSAGTWTVNLTPL